MRTIDVLLPVLFRERWQIELALACVRIMRCTTKVPFNLVVAETGSAELAREADRHVALEPGQGFVRDWNDGIRACRSEMVVATSSDVLVRPGWLEALLEPFDRIEDCGVSCPASSDLKMAPSPGTITEGVFGPCMMFHRLWPEEALQRVPTGSYDPSSDEPRGKQLDPIFAGVDLWADSDLVLAHYRAGMRSYRTYSVVVDHLNKATYDTTRSKEDQKKDLDRGQELFIRKNRPASHLRTFGYFVKGIVF